MRHLQIIKEHIYIRRFIAYINVQITALVYRHIVKQMGGKRITGAHLLKTTACTYIFKLLVKQYPVDKRFGPAAIISLIACVNRKKKKKKA
mgnify:CR=1 FL=1